MKNYTWASSFRSLFDRCAASYRAGDTSFATWFTADDEEFLAEIGCTGQELFDFVEDHCHAGPGGQPDAETALLVAAVRRDFFRVEMRRQASGRVVRSADLPAKSAELDGIVWLPRVLAKARAKLRGEMDADTMFGCGGDRAFFSRHDIHPADFLRLVWSAGDDDQVMLSYVKGAR